METLRSLTKSELIQVVEKLSSSVGDAKVAQAIAACGKQPTAGVARAAVSAPPLKKARVQKVRKSAKPFDMSKYSQRHIALQVGYFGENYFGLAAQEHLQETVEHHLFQALCKTRLVTDRASSNYSRCGRTDKGVSALGQVVSIRVRSLKPLPGQDTDARENESKPWSDDQELCYPSMLNRALPDDIFVLGWAAVGADFDARFMARSRTYRYFFSKRKMNLEAMREAGKLLEGEHDFRNFCKMDVTNVRNFVRKIESCKVDQLNEKSDMCFVEVSGNAFLWHQIRCIMAVLFFVGCGLEQPSIVKELLDVSARPRKPVYLMADELPLILFDSTYDNLNFRYDEQVLQRLQVKLENRLKEHQVRAALTSTVLNQCQSLLFGTGAALNPRNCDYDAACPRAWGKSGRYQPLLERKTCSSYEERIANLSKNKREAAKKRHGWNL